MCATGGPDTCGNYYNRYVLGLSPYLLRGPLTIGGPRSPWTAALDNGRVNT